MKATEAAALYARLGRVPPPDIAAPSAEYIRNTRRKEVDGIAFRSTLEADAYQVLKAWQQSGAITSLELQPQFLLQPAFRRDGKTIRAMTYRADFAFVRDGRKVVVETKGFRTEAFNIRRKLFLAKHPEPEYQIWTRETLRQFHF